MMKELSEEAGLSKKYKKFSIQWGQRQLLSGPMLASLIGTQWLYPATEMSSP